MLLGTALAVAGALCTPGARAANDAMIELLKVLKDQGRSPRRSLKAAAQADDEQNTAGQSEIKQAAETYQVETNPHGPHQRHQCALRGDRSPCTKLA